MKTNKAILKTVVNVVIFLVLAGLYTFAVINAYGLFKGKLLLYIALLVVGLIISLFINVLLHELGHLTVGLFSGLKLSKICVLVFLLEVKCGKLKFKIAKPQELGYTEMLPKTQYGYGEKLAFSALGGLMFSLITALASMAICINCVDNIYAFCLFGAPYPIALYVLLINALPLFDGSDGALIFSIFQGETTTKNYYLITANILLNKEPCEIDGKLFLSSGNGAISQNVKYLRFLHLLKSDFDRAYEEILALSKLDIVDDNLHFIVKKELFFCKVILGDEAYVNAHSTEVVGDIDLSEDACNFRVHATYRIFIKDYEFASLILKSGIQKLSSLTQNGIILSEIKYLKELQNQLKNIESL